METVLISLFFLALLLFSLSFFLHDPYKQIREEMEQFSMEQLQEMYQIKKKLKVLEEELLENEVELIPSFSKLANSEKKEIHDIIKNQVWSLAGQGTPIKQIAEQSSLSTHDVQAILREFSLRGEKHE